MDERLLSLIRDYQAAVKTAVQLLEAVGIPRPASTTEWVGYDVPGSGTLGDGGRYNIHGFGCAVNSPTVRVDFDFGAEGQIDGFDWSRLKWFANSKLGKRYRIADETELRSLFDNACNAGELTNSGYILWYVSGTINTNSNVENAG